MSLLQGWICVFSLQFVYWATLNTHTIWFISLKGHLLTLSRWALSQTHYLDRLDFRLYTWFSNIIWYSDVKLCLRMFGPNQTVVVLDADWSVFNVFLWFRSCALATSYCATHNNKINSVYMSCEIELCVFSFSLQVNSCGWSKITNVYLSLYNWTSTVRYWDVWCQNVCFKMLLLYLYTIYTNNPSSEFNQILHAKTSRLSSALIFSLPFHSDTIWAVKHRRYFS